MNKFWYKILKFLLKPVYKIYYNPKIYCKENLKVIFKNVEYVYNEHYMLINHKNNKYNFSEVVYDIDKHNIKVYNDGKYIKMVEMEQ